MNVLLDVNVLLDAFLSRKPFDAAATRILQAHDAGKIIVYVAASSLPNIFYLGRKHRKPFVGVAQATTDAFSYVHACLNNLEVVWLDAKIMHDALASSGDDLEDNLQLASAIAANLDAIITRDAKFVGTGMTILTPQQLLQRIKRRLT